MLRVALLIALLLAGCASLNPFHASESTAATLQSRRVAVGNDHISLMFVALDGKVLDPAGSRPVNCAYKTPPGDRSVLVHMVHARDAGPSINDVLMEANIPFTFPTQSKKTYVANATTDKGIATVWLEEAGSGIAVTDKQQARLSPLRADLIVSPFFPLK
jgi:hypothetical protein